jgi:hypothetical protein
MPFGVTLGRSGGGDFGDGGPDSCPTPVTSGRDDSCCAVTERDNDIPTGSVSMHRDLWPNQIFRFILAHEVGHYFGLCHFGHTIENLMWSAGATRHGSTGVVGLGTAHYLWSAEPEFTFNDAKNSWRFIVDQLPEIL